MALFQKSVLNQFIKDLDKNKVATAYSLFKAHFHNATIQQQIRDSKEEQYQEGFCRDLFVNVLGYTLNPQPNFNLTTEQKNETDSKKADGAILKDGNVIAVIELKGTNTTDLNTVTPQAFGYKNNQKNCKYVIVSNFEKFRFFIENAIDYEEFNLFTLTEDEFRLLYLCLHHENLLNDLPNKIKQASTVKEENITKQLYKDYSDLKRKLFTDIVHLNPQYDKLVLFKKSQKLLDRILFILFAEDRNLIPANTIHTILKEFENLKKLDAYQPLHERFKKHFHYLNVGYKNDAYEVYGYNGGLFAPDEILDSILISDNLLQNYIPILSKYDYETDVDVNILGHIFEHSLNDIEELQAEIDAQSKGVNPIGNKISKRKKDGVFYTPKYITKYIVENTVGALCTEKRNEYGIIADNYTPDKRKAKKRELLQSLDTYQNWLLQITIVDPACGSGAFLNQALDYLIQEHKSIDELRAQLLGHSFVLPDHEIEILENNIFGVDLNEESVEIARLSLWLRTARKGRKLNSLNNNIKCGNSLIDDVSIAGEKAFNWQNEFPQIFEKKDKQAFHVVLTTHNSRTSQRMIEKGVKKGEPLELNTKQEILLTEIIKNIVVEKNYKCLAYNICKDHVHIILVCERDELNDIVKTIKGKSAYLFNKGNGLKPIGESNKPIEESIEKYISESNGFQPVAKTINPVGEYTEKHEPDPNGLKPIGESIEKNEPKSNGFQPVEESNKPVGESNEKYELVPNGLKSIEKHELEPNGLKPVGNSIEKHELDSNGFQPAANREIHNGHLWSQKFFRANLDVWELNTVTNKPGYIYKDTYLQNAIEYVRNNRKKHELPQSDKLESTIESFCTDEETAFKQEHKGGFDVVIGNPPYLSMTKNNSDNTWLQYYIDKYESIKTSNSKNLFTLFNELASIILKQNGVLSFIIPEGFLKTRSYDSCVTQMEKTGTISKAVYFESWVFEDATTGSLIFEFYKNKNKKPLFKEYLYKQNLEIIEKPKVLNSVLEKYNMIAFPLIKESTSTFKGMAVQNRSQNIFQSRNNLPDRFLLGNCIGRYHYCPIKSRDKTSSFDTQVKNL